MSETRALQKPILRVNQIALPATNLTLAEQFRVSSYTSLIFYHQRWQQEIYNRFQEARKRFPEFFPCFELKYNPEGLEYSIHFKPLTRRAEDLTCQAPLFPTREEFKPIEELWSEDGQSELDIIFERFPTQLALRTHKEQWGQLWKSIVELIKQGLEFKHIGLAQRSSRSLLRSQSCAGVPPVKRTGALTVGSLLVRRNA